MSYRLRRPKKEETYLQRLVKTFRESVEELGGTPSEQQLESWACLVHESMSGYGRNYHCVEHVFEISIDACALQTIAALFHDCIYVNVDGGLSPKQLRILKGVINENDTKRYDSDFFALAEFNFETDRNLAMVASIFGLRSGQVLGPYSGENEFLSAVLAVRSMAGVLAPKYLFQIAACIENTIPFRKPNKETGKTAADDLFERLTITNQTLGIGMSKSDLVESVELAVDLGNRDVGNFATTDRAWFLDNTWKLLPESNMPLRQRSIYAVSDFQSALQKTECFFVHLDPTSIFQTFGSVPGEPEWRSMTRRATRNLELGRTYVRAKLVAVAVLASLAELTGGDCPLAMLCGDYPSSDRKTDRLEDYLPDPYTAPCGRISSTSWSICRQNLDEEVFELLAEGRKSSSKFDMRHSPLAAFLYCRLGNRGLDRCMAHVVHPMDKHHSRKLLQCVPKDAVEVVSGACSHIASTRADLLCNISTELNWDDDDGIAGSAHSAQSDSLDKTCSGEASSQWSEE